MGRGLFTQALGGINLSAKDSHQGNRRVQQDRTDSNTRLVSVSISWPLQLGGTKERLQLELLALSRVLAMSVSLPELSDFIWLQNEN